MMKTERRHELQKNELADQLAVAFERVAPYSTHILGGFAIVLVMVLGYRWIANTSHEKEASAWRSYFDAMQDRDEKTGQIKSSPLNLVAEKHSGTAAAAWARLRLAEQELGTGSDLMFTDRSKAPEELDKALADFKKVVEAAPSLGREHSDLLTPRALLGQARTQECQNNLEDAKKSYQSVIDQWPLGSHSSEAKKRIAAINSTPAAEFYDWFAQQKTLPPPAFDGLGTPGLRPPFDPFDPESLDKLIPKSDEPKSTPDEPKATPDAPKATGDAPKATPDAPKTSTEPVKDNAGKTEKPGTGEKATPP